MEDLDVIQREINSAGSVGSTVLRFLTDATPEERSILEDYLSEVDATA